MSWLHNIVSSNTSLEDFSYGLHAAEIEHVLITPSAFATKIPFICLFALFPVFIITTTYTSIIYGVGSIGVLSILILLSWSRATNTAFLVTDKRLITFHNKDETESFELSAIESIYINQSLLGTFFNYGTLLLETESDTYELAGVLEPYNKKTEIATKLDKPSRVYENSLDNVVSPDRIENADKDMQNRNYE